MSDALADAVAQAEAELAARPERVWVALRTERKHNTVVLMRVSLTMQNARALCNKDAKVELVWTQKGDSIFNSDYVSVQLQGEDADVRYTVLSAGLDPR